MLDKQFFLRYYQTYGSEDAAALGQFYADDIVLASSQGIVKGNAAMLDTYRYITSLFVDKMTPDSILIDGNRAAIEITDRFEAKTDVESFLGRSFRKGEIFYLKICGIYRVENDKIQQVTIYSGS